MKTTFEFVDGTTEEIEGVVPNISFEPAVVYCYDKEDTVVTEDVSLHLLKRIVIELGDASE
jgi:hypothetical protein